MHGLPSGGRMLRCCPCVALGAIGLDWITDSAESSHVTITSLSSKDDFDDSRQHDSEESFGAFSKEEPGDTVG